MDISKVYCPVNSPDIEAFKKLVGQQFDKEALVALDERIFKCNKDGKDYGVRVSDDGVTFARLYWYQHESDYIKFKAPEVDYEELTFGELPYDEKLNLVEHVLNGGTVERYEEQLDQWTDKYTGFERNLLCFVQNKKYRIKKIKQLTAKELFLREAGNYKTLEEMYDSGKFKIELIVDEE